MTLDESFRELGLAAGSSDAEVKEAWRRLAARWHPDRNKSPHALRKTQRINRAMEEIHKWRASGFADLPAASDEPADTPEELIERQVSITLEEACAGCARDLHGELVEHCGECHGSGHEPQASTCTRCDGLGRMRSNFWFPWLASGSECESCAGKGQLHAPCTACAATGQARPRRYRCRIDVPAGTRNGDTLHVRARVHGRALHLRVAITLDPHPFFQLEADGTVRCVMPVDGFTWMAERWTEAPSPRGLQEMRLRRNALTYRLKGHGLGDADCIITIDPLFPEELCADRQRLIDRLIAGNTGDRDSAAGKSMANWDSQLGDWRARTKH